MLSKTFRIERSTIVDAPADTIFPLINDFRGWAAWSPYEKRDPGMVKQYGGAPSGVGAAYEWKGNRHVGEGRMQITDASPVSRVAIDLQFIKPFPGRNTAAFTLTPEGTRTRVSWAMEGPMALVPRLMSLVIDMDKMIGRDFEAGLANLKAVAEESVASRSVQW
jgi:polyketide cyclase/dehydrase/lipid transport protein